MANLNDIEKQKMEKLKEIQSRGIYPFGEKYKTDDLIENIKNNYKEGKKVSVAGRLMAVREHGKTVFYDLRDSTDKIQLYAGEKTHCKCKKCETHCSSKIRLFEYQQLETDNDDYRS